MEPSGVCGFPSNGFAVVTPGEAADTTRFLPETIRQNTPVPTFKKHFTRFLKQD
jgi:pyruvate/2-oxoglutarate/acetoin dehydrogenase E1 component